MSYLSPVERGAEGEEGVTAGAVGEAATAAA
jgi:hypothetical protein